MGYCYLQIADMKNLDKTTKLTQGWAFYLKKYIKRVYYYYLLI